MWHEGCRESYGSGCRLDDDFGRRFLHPGTRAPSGRREANADPKCEKQ